MSPVLLHNVILSWWHPQRVSADYPDNFHAGKEVGESNKNDDDDDDDDDDENSRNDRGYLEYIIVLGQTMRDLKVSQVALVVKNLLPMKET